MKTFKLWLNHQGRWGTTPPEPISEVQADDPVTAVEIYAREHATETVVQLLVQGEDGDYLEIDLVHRWELTHIKRVAIKDLGK